MVGTAIDDISFKAKATHFISAERIGRLKPGLNEELRSLSNSKPTSSEYLFGENMNKSLKVAKKNPKLSLNLVITKLRNKVVGPLSRAGFKQRPDHEPGNNFSSRNQVSLNFQGQESTYTLRTQQFQRNIKSKSY